MPSTTADHIELSFAADPGLVSLARFTAAAVATRAGFDVEELEDLRLAVDELCATLGPFGQQDTLRLTFERGGPTVHITVSLIPSPGTSLSGRPPGAEPAQAGKELAERLLDELADEHGFEIREGYRCAWLRKRAATTRL